MGTIIQHSQISRIMKLISIIFGLMQLALGQDSKTCEKAAVVNTLRVCVRYCAKNYKAYPDCGGPTGPTMENILSLANIPFCEDMYDSTKDKHIGTTSSRCFILL